MQICEVEINALAEIREKLVESILEIHNYIIEKRGIRNEMRNKLLENASAIEEAAEEDGENE